MKKVSMLLPLLAIVFAVTTAFTNSKDPEDKYYTNNGINFKLINTTGDCEVGSFHCEYKVRTDLQEELDLNNPDHFEPDSPAGFVWIPDPGK